MLPTVLAKQEKKQTPDWKRETGDSRKQIQIPLPRSAARAAQPSPLQSISCGTGHMCCGCCTGKQLRRRRRLQELLLLNISPSSLLPLPVNKKQSKVRRNICKLQVAVARGKVKEIAANSGNISWRAAWLPNAANCESRQ